MSKFNDGMSQNVAKNNKIRNSEAIYSNEFMKTFK